MQYFLVVLAMLTPGFVWAAEPAANVPAAMTQWTPAGWGGGGFYYAAAYHPTRDGVIYLAGDVGGVYRSDDHGRSWLVINNGLVNYGVFSLAVDRKNPDTIYAATDGGLCKSVDSGSHWQLLPRTGPKDLHLTGEKGKSIHCIAVDPTDGNIVYAVSPAGKIFKSIDGGQSWSVSYEKKVARTDQDALWVQFGRVNGDFFGGLWMPVAFPNDASAEGCNGFGFSFKGEGAPPRDVFLTLTTAGGVVYRSRNLTDLFKGGQWTDVVLGNADFTVDPASAKKFPEQAKSQPTPVWSTVNRLDFSCVGSLPDAAAIGHFGKFFFSFPSPDAAAKPILMTVREFSKNKAVQNYGNVRLSASGAGGGTIYSVAIAPERAVPGARRHCRCRPADQF